MKRIMLIIGLILGIGLSTGCGAAYYSKESTSLYQNLSFPQYTKNDVYYRNSRLTYDGTWIVGDRGFPTGLIWRNASMYRRGMIVTFYNANQEVIAQYDLRVPRQQVCDTFYVEGLTGKALEVCVVIKGGPGSTNYLTVSDGEEKRIYNLCRE